MAFESSQLSHQLLVDAAVDYAIYMLNERGQVVTWNTGAARVKGYAAEEIIGRHFSTFYTEADIAAGKPQKALQIARETGRYQTEGWRRRKDGSRFWAAALLDAVRDETGRLVGFAKVTRDLTQQRQLTEMSQQLAQSQKMEALGQLTGGIAHDFNNLLGIIGSSIESVQRQIARKDHDMARIQRRLDHALRGTQRASALIRHLLAFARRQPLEPKPIVVNELIGGMLPLLRRSLGETIEVTEKLDDGLWRSFVDQNQLENALLNLAINARDAMPDGGRLTIATRNTELTAGPALQSGLSPGAYVAISLSDTGVGMSRDVIERAFDPFFTTKPAGAGTGLGLSQVYGFVKQSGGHIEISSEIGCGTTVTILLPRHFQPQESDSIAAAPQATVAPAGSETVLVVEDDADLRAAAAEMLRELGYQVLEAGDAAAALALLRSRLDIALLFTDIVLPGAMNGRSLADEASSINPHLRVLFTTGYAQHTLARQGNLEPGLHLIAKPFSFFDLAVKTRAALDSPPQRPWALLVEDEALVRAAAADALRELGFEVEESASAMGAMNKLRLARSRLTLAIIDIGLPDLTGDILAAELRASRPHLPIIIATGRDTHSIPDPLRSDPLLRLLPKPYDERDIEVTLRSLRVPVPVALGDPEPV
ncbi:MAG TPA: response regulator [Ferrovibrio sp.]|uniref:response regulator n=1 Tax=Ferrovibrio sp. TaxID=1917215 RepID=UPI002ED19412